MKTAAIRLNIPNIRLYDIFRKDLHLPDERAHDLVQAMGEGVEQSGMLILKPSWDAN